MRRITRDDVYYAIYVALKVTPKRERQALVSKLPQESDDAASRLAEALTARILGDDNVLIGPSLVRKGDEPQRPGKWDVDEPYPFAELDAPPPRPPGPAAA